MPYYAHSREGEAPQTWQPLEDHLTQVANLAAGFADAFDAAEWGRLAGLWHDLGKYQDEFQRKLQGEKLSIEHAGAGAAWAMDRFKGKGTALAFLIAGHHAGLANWKAQGTATQRCLQDRLATANKVLPQLRDAFPPELTAPECPPVPAFPPRHLLLAKEANFRRQAFWTRLLFSALVDADYLDTEQFMDPQRAALRRAYDTPAVLAQRLRAHLDTFMSALTPAAQAHPVNRTRAEVLAHCRAAAHQPPGLFSLTVPTGGGKTLASMAFALDHAVQHGLRRVIVVLPYTSIIEQNAQVYRDALGSENVIEHHAALNPEHQRDRDGHELTGQHNLAAENWDAPIIVTTTVQFLESLHANRSSRCRKLHNIAQSVVILDEVQALPKHLLAPILDVLNEVMLIARSTIVLSTATPPALQARENLPQGLPDGYDIIPNSDEIFARLQRVRYHWPKLDEPSVEWVAMAERLKRHRQVLCIVDRRADARELAELVSAGAEESTYHLSALMCPAHRLQVIQTIKQRLRDDLPCRVVSTQLVEAGVDLDFPVVYRALAGLHSIVQAAGRCNREGKLEFGDVYLFRAPKDPPPGELRSAKQETESLLREMGDTLPVETPEIFDRYFRALYAGSDLDTPHILTDAQELNFATVANNFKMIDDAGQFKVICPWGEGERHIAALRAAQEGGYLHKDLYRAVQPYSVQIYANQQSSLHKSGVLEVLTPDLWTISHGYKKAYSASFGLLLEGALGDPEAFYV